MRGDTRTGTSGRRRHGVRRLATALLVATTATGIGSDPSTASAESPTWAAPASVGSSAAAYVPIGPLRLADTRRPSCGCTIVDGSTIAVPAASHADIPDDAVAVAVTITALPTSQPGHITVYPDGGSRPNVSTVNTMPDRVVANSAIIPLGPAGGIELFRLRPGHVVVDVSGAFIPASSARAGRYQPLPAQRLVDTRTPTSPSGPIPRGGTLRVPLPSGVASDATALVVNITSVREPEPGHLSVRPARSAPRTSSVLNVDGSGAAVAASVIVPVDSSGFAIDSFRGGHVVVDALGWFTGPSAADTSDGLFVPLEPQRVVDTREVPGRLHPGGTIEVASVVPTAAALVTNVTATRADRAGHITALPARTAIPSTSTVNPTHWNHTVANFAITTQSTHGLAYRSHAGVDLVVDAFGWFTGTRVAATTGAPTNAPPPTPTRVLLVGDSTLAAVDLYSDAKRALIGFDSIVDAKSCRRLMRPSCLSAVTGVIPNTAVEAILTTPGRLDVVVVKTGYNDWFSDFPIEFDAVVRAARQKGAHTILWLTYNVDVRPHKPRSHQAYVENNVDVRRLANEPRYRDVVLADWLSYSRPHQFEWFWDGTHMTREGTWAQTDYVSRWIAALEHRPCPRPRVPGGPVADPCPPPDSTGAFATPSVLYP